MKKLNKAQITAKCVEISKCLISTAPGLVLHDLDATLTVGDATRLAVAIRNHSEPIGKETLAGVSSALKIDSRIVESVYVPMWKGSVHRAP